MVLKPNSDSKSYPLSDKAFHVDNYTHNTLVYPKRTCAYKNENGKQKRNRLGLHILTSHNVEGTEVRNTSITSYYGLPQPAC